MSKLKPCPFCGKKPHISKHFKEDMHQLVHRCNVVGTIILEWGDLEDHIMTWNTRTGEVNESKS